MPPPLTVVAEAKPPTASSVPPERMIAPIVSIAVPPDVIDSIPPPRAWSELRRPPERFPSPLLT